MAATGTPTPNIGLRRPQGTDPASVDDINYNSNLIDTKLGAVGNTSVQEQINSLNSKLSTVTFKTVSNVNDFTVDLGYEPTSAKFGQLILFNANQGSLNMISVGNTINVVKVIGNTTLTATVSGQIITIQASGTLWGDTVIMINHN